MGTGHFYARKVRRGAILLIIGWLMIGAAFVLIAIWSMSGMVIPPEGYPRVEPPAIAPVFLIAAIVFFLGFGGLWIWQILDARAACRAQNSFFNPT
ncbi:hypothetical protein ACFLYR_02305 [Chloroflexota bacterium]